MESSRPHVGELVAAACGLLLIVSLFLTWYSRDTDIAGAVISQTWTAWQATPVIASVLFAVGVVALVAPAVSGRFRADRLAMLAGAFGLLLVLFRMVDLPLPDIELQGSDHADSSRAAGLFLALLAAAGIAFGGRIASRAGPR